MALRVKTTFAGLTGAPYLNLMHFTGTGGTAASAAAVAVSNFWGEIDARMHTSLTWTRDGSVEEFNEETGAITALHATDAVSGAGALGGEPLPFAVQGLVRWRTGVFVDGREVRGRTFVPGLTESDSTSGVLGAGAAAAMTSAAGTLEDALAIWQRPKVDRTVDPPVVERIGTIVPVASHSIAVQFAVLRSRRD